MWLKVIVGVLVVGALGWIGWYVTRPVPGTRMEDEGREHVSVEVVAAYQYNSNPPTSGPHLPRWVKPGIYDTPQSEGELIHSLEHGYVIISYNCTVHLRSFVIPGLTRNPAFLMKDGSRLGGRDDMIVATVYAHEEDGATTSAEFVDPTTATGSAANESEGCNTLIKDLTELANKKRLWKLVVVPRPPQSNAAGTFDVPQLPTTIALTAWNYIDTFDDFDAGRIERFIDYHRDQGPEKTME